MSSYEEISRRAEADLNTDQAKQGTGEVGIGSEAGVNSQVESRFENAEVLTGDELSTNRGYNKRIPESEGGDLDARGRAARGNQYEGEGGPLDKVEKTGDNDNDVVPANVSKSATLGNSDDILTEGRQATQVNVGRNPPGVGGSKYKGEDYYTAESVPDSISAEGNIAPDSVTEASRETEGYER